MDQPALFHESFTDALRDVIKALGGVKAVGASMRSDLSPDHAGRWLSDCLNDERREKLSPEQVVLILRRGREIGMHSAMAYLSQECGYAATPIEPEDERAALQREYIEAAKAMAKVASRIEQLAPAMSVRIAA